MVESIQNRFYYRLNQPMVAECIIVYIDTTIQVYKHTCMIVYKNTRIIVYTNTSIHVFMYTCIIVYMNKHSNLIEFSVLSLYHTKVYHSEGLYRFSKVKYSNLVEFNSITLYHTKVLQFSRNLTLYYGKVGKTLTLYCDKVYHNCRTLTLYYAKVYQSNKIFTLYHFTALKYTVLVDFTLLKCYSGNVVTYYYDNKLKRSPLVDVYPGSIYSTGELDCKLQAASWELQAGSWELQAGSWAINCELRFASWDELNCKLHKDELGSNWIASCELRRGKQIKLQKI